jgi:hypothetical protein
VTVYDRAVLVDVILNHGRTRIQDCHCGWAVIGSSHADHVADVYEQEVAARLDVIQARPLTGEDVARALAVVERMTTLARLDLGGDLCSPTNRAPCNAAAWCGRLAVSCHQRPTQ